VVANHVSWLDVLALNALWPATFVCKSEVRRWPVLGWLIGRDGTLFLERGNARQARRLGSRMARRLSAGERIALFPEGTTSDGTSVLPFRPALLQAAIASGAPVQPVALSYSDPAAAFVGEMTFWESLRRVSRACALEARAELCEPVACAGLGRREVASLAQGAIQTRLGGRDSLPRTRNAGAAGARGSGSPSGSLPSSAAQTWPSRTAVSRA
jgi:1-acyl-sn-glycerol-3-phosphate acyltransferase